MSDFWETLSTSNKILQASQLMITDHPFSHERHEMWAAMSDWLWANSKGPLFDPNAVRVAEEYLKARA